MALQDDFGEKEMRGRTANIDANSLELDMLLTPDVARKLGTLFFCGPGLSVLVEKFGIVH